MKARGYTEVQAGRILWDFRIGCSRIYWGPWKRVPPGRVIAMDKLVPAWAFVRMRFTNIGRGQVKED